MKHQPPPQGVLFAEPPRDIVHTKVYLRDRPWSLLVEWVSRPTGHTKHGDEGGMQQRRVDWASRMNEREHSIQLTTHSSNVRKTLDDVSWIAKTIINHHAGGFQDRIFNIFAGSHPAFTDLPIKPRTPRKSTGRRGGRKKH